MTIKEEGQALQKRELLRVKNHLDKPSPTRQAVREASKPQHASQAFRIPGNISLLMVFLP